MQMDMGDNGYTCSTNFSTENPSSGAMITCEVDYHYAHLNQNLQNGER